MKQLGRDEDIVTTTSVILELDPENMAALEDKGAALINLSRNDEAISIFERIVKLEPKNLGAIYKMGVADAAVSLFPAFGIFPGTVRAPLLSSFLQSESGKNPQRGQALLPGSLHYGPDARECARRHSFERSRR